MTNWEDLISATFGLTFESNNFLWQVDDSQVKLGQWCCFVPRADQIYPDASLELAGILALLKNDYQGQVVIFGKDLKDYQYDARLNLHPKIGFVQSSGGLLANRTLLENILYPLSFLNQGLTSLEDRKEALNLMLIMGISNYADYKVHDIDDMIRWRTCLCRALIIQPKWLILEGVGDWGYYQAGGLVWHFMENYLKNKGVAITFCLPKRNQIFEKWFVKAGGMLTAYRPLEVTN